MAILIPTTCTMCRHLYSHRDPSRPLPFVWNKYDICTSEYNSWWQTRLLSCRWEKFILVPKSNQTVTKNEEEMTRIVGCCRLGWGSLPGGLVGGSVEMTAGDVCLLISLSPLFYLQWNAGTLFGWNTTCELWHQSKDNSCFRVCVYVCFCPALKLQGCSHSAGFVFKMRC